MVRKKVSPQYKRKVMVEATILEVISPSHFIVRETPNPSMSHEANQFIEMEERLNKYYSSREVLYSSMPEKDEVVVILPEGEEKWYRASVIFVLETTRGPSVNCYLLDYGGRKMVCRERMYKISEEFLSVPFQAVDFILLGIKPMAMTMDSMLKISYGPAKDWDCASKEYVKELCAKMDVAYMEILGFDSDGHIYGNLHIETDKNMFCLNEALVTQKHAVLSMEDCESIQKSESFEVNNNVEPVKNPVPNENIPLPENYTLERYLAELFDHNGDLTKEDLKSLRESLENKVEDKEVQGPDTASGSLSEAKPKACLSRQYVNMKAALKRSRPCSKISQKNIDTSPNESTDADNASASNLKTCPPLSSSLQSKVRSLYKRNLAASKFTSSQTSSVSSLSPEEKTGKLSVASFSSCSVPVFSTDDESASRQPTTPFPEEEASHQYGEANSNYGETLSKNSSVVSWKKTNDPKMSSSFSSSNELNKKSLPVNVSCSGVSVGLGNADLCKYPVHTTPYHKSEASDGSPSPNNSHEKHSSSPVSSLNSTCDVTSMNSYNVGRNSNVTPEKDVRNCTSSSSSSSTVRVSSTLSSSQSPKDVDYSSVKRKLRLPKGCVSSRASLSKGSPSALDTSSHQQESSSSSLEKCTNSSSRNSEKSLPNQVSQTVSSRQLSKTTDYGSLRKKLLRLQKGRVSSNTALANGSSAPVAMDSQCESVGSSSEKCENSFSHSHMNKSSPDRCTVSLSSSVSSSPSPNPIEALQSSQPLNKTTQNALKSLDSKSMKCGDFSMEKQSSQKMLSDSPDQVISQTHSKYLSSVTPEKASPPTQAPSHCNKQLPSKELLSVAPEKIPAAKCGSIMTVVSSNEKFSDTHKKQSLDSEQNNSSDAQNDGLSNEFGKLPLLTTNESSSDKVSNKDEHCLQNKPSVWQSNGKKVSVDELFASCKEQGKTVISVSNATSYKPSSSKILEHVRRAVKKGVLHPINQNPHHQGMLKNTPISSVAGVTELQVSPVDAYDCFAENPQPGSQVNSKGLELETMQKHDDVSELPSKVGETYIDANSIEKISSDSDSGHVDSSPEQQNGCGLTVRDSPAQTPDFHTENTRHVRKRQELQRSSEMKPTDDSRRETSEEKSASEFHLNGDVCTLKDDASGVSEDSSGDEDSKVYRSTTYSVVQSLTQKIINPNNGICGQYFKTELDFSDKSLWEMVSIPAVSIGKCVPPPLLRTEEVPFTEQIRKRLGELCFWGPSCIQSVVWPAVFRNRSFAAIAPPASGKTIAYLLPLLSMLIDGTKYKDLPASHAAVILILCSTWFKVAKLHDQCMNLLKGTNKVKVKVLYSGGGDKDQEVSLFNGCDILISTPPSLLHYLQKKATNFDRCCNIILDDGAQLIEHCKDEISSIMQELLVHIKRIKQPTAALQIGICSEKWTKGVASFAEKFLLMPLLFFTSFLEAAVYAKIPVYIHSCTAQTIDYMFLGLLGGIICPKAVVCTRDIETAKHVHGVLQAGAVFSMLAHDDKPQYELTAIKRRWNLHHHRDSTFILVITDSALLSMNIRDADCIFHYDLPEISRLSFSQRFGCFGNYLCQEHDPNQQKRTCHILITEECKVQAPTLLKLMNRMGLEYPKQLLHFACEQKKLSLNRLEGPLCEYMKAFGVCKDSRCVQRHTIVSETDSPTVVPKQGEIKAVVIKVIDTSHYVVKILEYTDPKTSETTVVSAQYTKMFLDLKNYYSQPANKVVAGMIRNGKVYGIEECSQVFYRVQVLEIISLPNKGETQKVKVFFLDDGWIKEKETSELLILPKEFQSSPQMCVEAYLSNIKTVDSCNKWTPQANMFVSEVITGKEIHATIALCLGDTIWLDPLVLKEGNSINVLKLDRTLKRLGLALPNMDHLQNLYKACVGKVDLPLMSRSAEKSKKKSKPVQTVDYAFLDVGVCEDVYVPDVISPQEFFVQRCKFYDRLNILEKELSDLHKKEELKKCQSVWEGMYCIASFPDDGKLYRAQVEGFKGTEGAEVDVFFADYGDSTTAHRSNLYTIPPKFLLLPFQAIKCELAGISAPQGKWPAEAGDMLFGLTRYENDDLKTLTAKAFQKTSSNTSGSLYTIQLLDGSLNISECLVKDGLAVQAELPELPPLPSDNNDKQPDVDLDDMPSGYISASSDGSMESADVEASALFYAALCGLYTPEVNRCPKTPKTVAAYPPASVEEVVESASDCDVILKDLSPPESPATDHPKSSPKNSPSTNLKPSVIWWDTPEELFITIKLLGVQTYDLCPFIDGFSFSTDLGDKHYFVEVTFFAEVIPEKTAVDCQGQDVRITFYKRDSKKWPRLTQLTEKVFYIKRDLEHIDTESEGEKSESPDFCVPRSPVKKEDICHVPSTTEAETSADDSDYDSSWQGLCQPKEMYI